MCYSVDCGCFPFTPMPHNLVPTKPIRAWSSACWAYTLASLHGAGSISPWATLRLWHADKRHEGCRRDFSDRRVRLFDLVTNMKILFLGSAVAVGGFIFLKYTSIGQSNYQINRLRTALDSNDPVTTRAQGARNCVERLPQQ